jgi:predicted kinase
MKGFPRRAVPRVVFDHLPVVPSRAMIIHLNGWPGVGKLTIAHLLTQDIGGRLLDSHTIYNVAFSVTDFGTPTFYDIVRRVRDIAFERVAELPARVPVVMTNAYADTPFGNENWRAIRALADRRRSKLFVVVLDCSPEENARRIQSPERARLRKLLDASKLLQYRQKHTLLEGGGDHVLRIDTTALTPKMCADQIAQWIRSQSNA